MTQSKKWKRAKIFAGILCLLIIVQALSPVSASGGVCEKALGKCGADAAIAGLLSGFQTFAFYSSGCLMGYSWCLEYYMKK